jgi:subtilisin family serine protease
MSVNDIEKEYKRLELDCECEVEHLKNVGAFILSYTSTTHSTAKSLKLDTNREIGVEDEVVTIFDTNLNDEHEEYKEDAESRRKEVTPRDPLFKSQWPLKNIGNGADINIQEGWNEYLSDTIGGSNNGPEVIVAVIDTGVDYYHPDLQDIMWNNPGETPGNGIDDDGNGIIDDVFGADFTGKGEKGDPIDKYGHGTHCAGVIGAKENNGEGIAGVASFTQNKVKIMAVKGITDGGSGTLSGLLMALNYAIGHGAKVSSNSWGSNSSISHAAERAWDNVLQNNPNHLFVASAGNNNKLIDDKKKPWTCGLNEPNLLCVASSTKEGGRSSFSNYGRKYVHVFAPGSAIYSTLPNNRYGPASGTSMACPHVSGVAALILTMRCDLSGQQIKELILENVRKNYIYEDLVSSGGIIDVGKTIRALKTAGIY